MGDDAQTEAEILKDIDDLALVGRASTLAPDLDTDDGDEDGYWRIIHELHRRGTRVIFDEAGRLTLSDDPRARRLACDVLSQLGYEHGRPFGAETFPLLARVCTEEASAQVLASAVSAMGRLRQPETLAFVVAHAKHSEPDVRFSVACALPSIAGVEWLDPAHPAVTTLMLLTSDDDADVRDWATFGLGTQVKVDGAAVRQCLLARVDDQDEDTRAEAIAGLARRHAPEIVRHIRDALGAVTVGRLMVESACSLGDSSFAEPLAQLANWWDVDVDLLEDARRRCDPTRIDEEANLVKALLDAAEPLHVSISVSSELLSDGTDDPEVSVVGVGIDVVYAMEALMRRAGGSADAAVQLIRHDLDEPERIPDPPEALAVTAVSDGTARRLIDQLKNEISQLRVSQLPAGLQVGMRSLQMQALQGLHAELDAQLPKQVLEIDGRCFDDLDGFFEHVGQRLIPGASWGKNLDAFNDILRGGFGTPDEGFILRWANASASRERLGFDETVRYIERKLTRCRASNGPAVEADLASARRGEGETLFDLIVDIVRAHGPGGIEAEDGVWLDLD